MSEAAVSRGGATYKSISGTVGKQYVAAEADSSEPMPQPDLLHITLDENSGIPLWLQLRNRIIYLITSGAYEVGEKLPTVREMAVELGINYNTVSKVYQDVERDGYIVSKRGKGTFVHDGYLKSGNGDVAVDAADALADMFIQQCRELGMPRNEIVHLVDKRLKAAER